MPACPAVPPAAPSAPSDRPEAGRGRSPAPDAASTLAHLLDERHSCRAFRDEPLPRQTILRIATLAQRTASWCNAQPWQVVVLSGASRDRLAEALCAAARAGRPPAPDFPWPAGYPGVLGDRRRACGYALYDSVGVARGDRVASARQTLENFRFFGAPHVAIVTSAADLGVYGTVDCGGYVATFMLAARSLGVATIAQAALASWSDVVRETLALAPDRRVVCGISFGIEDGEHPANGFRTDRESVDEVIDWRD